jgi:hypothetical protein
VLENFCVTVADVVGDGLLGMNFLAATDAWVGLRDGHLHMKQDGEEVTWPLRREDQTARYVALPIQSVIVDPMSQTLVPCTVKGPSGEDGSRPTGTVMAEPIGSLTPVTRVPAMLVEMDGEVLILVTNFGTRTLYIGSDMPLAAVENFDSVQEIPGSPEATAGTATETPGRDLPEHLQSLFERSVVDLPDAADRIAIHGMLADFAESLLGPMDSWDLLE